MNNDNHSMPNQPTTTRAVARRQFLKSASAVRQAGKKANQLLRRPCLD
jgi:hypothetical protein